VKEKAEVVVGVAVEVAVKIELVVVFVVVEGSILGLNALKPLNSLKTLVAGLSASFRACCGLTQGTKNLYLHIVRIEYNSGSFVLS